MKKKKTHLSGKNTRLLEICTMSYIWLQENGQKKGGKKEKAKSTISLQIVHKVN